jgi:hypothetical protein
MGRAIKGAMDRHASKHPFKGKIPEDQGDVYKVSGDYDALNHDEELSYLQLHIPGLSSSDYQRELDAWEQVMAFPVVDSFPIANAMAAAHYGY